MNKKKTNEKPETEMSPADKETFYYWRDASKELPDKNGLYVVCKSIFGHRFFTIVPFAKNLYEINEYAFADDKGTPGWYDSDPIDGFYKLKNVIYWSPLPPMPNK